MRWKARWGCPKRCLPPHQWAPGALGGLPEPAGKQATGSTARLQGSPRVASGEMGTGREGTCFSCIQKLRAAEALKLAVQATVHPHLGWGGVGSGGVVAQVGSHHPQGRGKEGGEPVIPDRCANSGRTQRAVSSPGCPQARLVRTCLPCSQTYLRSSYTRPSRPRHVKKPLRDTLTLAEFAGMGVGAEAGGCAPQMAVSPE